ncbi:hypothetical protein ACQ4PT_018454 [Festuca glaucescens]
MAERERGGGIEDKVPRWIETDYWYGIDENWATKGGCGLSTHRHVAYEGIETGRKFMGCHYKTPMCNFLLWVDKQNSAPVFHKLVSMWRLAEKKEIEVIEEEFQKALEEARQEKSPARSSVYGKPMMALRSAVMDSKICSGRGGDREWTPRSAVIELAIEVSIQI